MYSENLTQRESPSNLLAVHDAVNRPSHYTQGAVECIDAIKSALGEQGFVDYCIGNSIKYLFRWRHKGGLEDLRKAQWYVSEAIKQHGA
jgi:hypothetical protein